MPNARRAGQSFVGFQADEALVDALDEGRGFKDRSLFIREAIAEKLRALGKDVPPELIYPKDRAKRTKANRESRTEVVGHPPETGPADSLMTQTGETAAAAAERRRLEDLEIDRQLEEEAGLDHSRSAEPDRVDDAEEEDAEEPAPIVPPLPKAPPHRARP